MSQPYQSTFALSEQDRKQAGFESFIILYEFEKSRQLSLNFLLMLCVAIIVIDMDCIEMFIEHQIAQVLEDLGVFEQALIISVIQDSRIRD